MPFTAEVARSAPGEHWSTRKREIWAQLGATFLHEGFRSLTIGDLADRLSCSRRTLYSLAASRDELVLGVVEHLYASRTAVAATAVAGHSGPDAIVALLVDGALSFSASGAFVRDVLATPATRQILDDFRLSARTRLLEALATGVADGSLGDHDAEVVADLLEAVTERLGSLCQDPHRAVDDGDAREILEDLVRRWLAA